ncbi:MAG: hypothetical protein JNK14_11705 [Chitinophagaceae bacterium]|nr:hypothetical protein [Chitinophagaceae bacterium]
MTRKTITILAFLFCYCLILFRWLNIPIADAVTEARVGVYGDAFSSRNVHSAAMWFKDIGYTKTKGLPVFNYTGNLNQSGTEVYTHYPSLPDILGGVYARTLNTKDPYKIAVFPILLSIIFFFILQLVLKKILPDSKSAFISWVLLVISCYFICWADDLHQHLYTELLKWVYIYILYLYFTEQRKRWMLPSLCMIYFVQSWLTFESIPFLAIITVGFFILFDQKLFSPACLLLLVMPIAGVALHLFQNYLYFGDWSAVIADMKAALLKRTTGQAGNELGRAVQSYDFVKMWTYEFWFRMGRTFALPAISIIVIAAFALRSLYFHHRTHFKMAIIFFLAGIAWIFVMPQHAIVHTFTIKHMGVFVAFVSGYGILQYMELLKKHLVGRTFYWLAVHILFIFYTIGGFLYNQGYYVYLKFSLAYPRLGMDANLW